jgi:hypothetical protein
MTSRSCHPEWSLAKSEAILPPQSKDPCCSSAPDGERSFRITVRFIEDMGSEELQGPEHFPIPSHELAPCESSARQSRVDRLTISESRTPKRNDIVLP